MTNREAYKDKLDDLLARIIAVVDGEPVRCWGASCERCLFQDRCGKPEHKKKLIDWLNAEYQEPPVDWSKVPIDTPVLVSGNGKTWYRRYFAGIRNGYREAYDVGATPWSVYDNRTCAWPFMKIAEGNE